VAVAFLIAALVTVAVGAVDVGDVYGMIDWRLIVLIATMTSLGLAMEQSGAAGWLAEVIVTVTGPLGMTGLLVGFAVLTMALTQPMSNAAAALVVLPVAMSTAANLGVSQRSFAVLVTLAASLSFFSPWEPSCLLVYGPGGYRFRDFIVAGLPLTLVSLGVLVGLVLLLWPPA
jgi:di/tricarboxylate transporter